MNYKLQDLIDMEHFQNMQDRLNGIYSFPSAIIDNEGVILTATAWQDICTQFHRKNKDCEQDCIQSDQYILSHLHEANPAVSYRCPHGLVDNAIPIIIDGIHYGNFFTGQFFLEKPDMEFFRAQGNKYGFDEDAYLDAVKKVPIWTQEQLNNYLFFIKGLIAIISESGLKKLKESETRKQSEESEKKYKFLIEATSTGYVIIDTQGRVIEANEEYVRMTGHSRVEDIVGRSVTEWTAEHDLIRNAEEVKKCMHCGFVRNLIIDYVDKQGRTTPVEINATMLPNPQPSRIYTICRDITERRRAEGVKRSMEERLQRAEKMEALGKLAGGVAHDLNNVLGVLLGYSELLLERIPEGDPLKEYAAHILKSSEKGAAIIQDLLTLTRRGVVVSTVVDFNSMVSNLFATAEFNKLHTFHPNVTFKTDLEKNLLNIKGSPVHLEKMLMNLISNAAEAILGSGEVTIRTENRYLDKSLRSYDELSEGDYVVLTVSDTGGGISTADLDKIFEPFYTKKSMGRSGTGLGLAIVWGTVKDHEGAIDVQSIEGTGTAFTLYFPVTREKMGEDALKTPIEQYIGNGESILVVDDVHEQRQVASSMLTRLRYQVNSVSSGEEAVEYLKTNVADILVLDMIMAPGIDGLETYKRIIEINPHQKAIIVSGFSETEQVQKAQKLGAGAFVKKPYLLENIGMAVRQELDRKKS